jgi:hypothetical protein
MANVELSAAEMELMCNASIILTKNTIVEKVYLLLGNVLQHFQQNEICKKITAEIQSAPPKISKGENYEGLPWVMLDYPRYFTRNDVFAVRIFFWWGNFFSITLQTKGKFKERFQVSSNKLQVMNDWYLCCNEDEWQHHFREDNYKHLSAFTKNEIEQLLFIKLAKKIPLNKWDEVEIFLKNAFDELMNAISTTQAMK